MRPRDDDDGASRLRQALRAHAIACLNATCTATTACLTYPLVILRRIYDAGGISRAQLSAAYAEEVARLALIVTKGGGNFYLTQAARVGKRFARALVVSTLEGQTLHRDAFRLLGFRSCRRFVRWARLLATERAPPRGSAIVL